MTWDRGYRRVVLELDNLNVINWISFLKDIIRMIDFPWQIKVHHTLREGNRMDAMVNLGINLTLGY